MEVGADTLQEESAILASGTHFPQQEPTPKTRARSRMLVAPPFTAWRIWRSETALQMHTIIVLKSKRECE